jgi:uncharacterized protein YaaN involved in tellurite resistance
LAPETTAFQRKVGELASLGQREIRAISDMTARFTDEPDHAFHLFEDTAPVARSLAELRAAVERLDPSTHKLGRRRRPLGVLRRRDPLEVYFDSYVESEDQIRQLVGALRDGRSDLERDNAFIVQEQRSLTALMKTLRQYAYLTQRLDEEIETASAAMAASDPVRARLLADEVLFPLRQRRRDILTHLAVSAQGLAALAILKDGNDQLIRAVETVTTTTVAALRTAVMVAQALTSHHQVAAQLKSVDEFAAVVEAGAAALADTAGAEQGAGIAGLQRAWDAVFAALDEVDAHKRNAREAVAASMRRG